MINGRYLVCGVVLKVFYRAIRVLSHVDSRIRDDLLSLPEGQVVRLSVAASAQAPRLTFRVTNGSIVRERHTIPADIDIVFKNDRMAFRMFTGRLDIAGAYAAHAFTLRGNINDTMAIVRIVDLVEGYLFPKFIAKGLLKEIPQKQYPTILVYLRLIPGV